MLRTDVMVSANDPALQDREIAFHRVCVCFTAHVLASKMVHNIMIKVSVHMPVLTSIVRDQLGFVLKLFNQNRPSVSRRKHSVYAPTERDLFAPEARTQFPCPTFHQRAS
jgi:hypothetical protein